MKSRTPSVALAILVALLATLVSGCFSSEEGEALKRDVEELKKRLSSRVEEGEKARKRLQKVMEQATALLTRNSADVGAQVERIQQQYAKLTGQLEELQKQVHDANQKFAQLQAKVEVNTEKTDAQNQTQAPATPQELLKQAQAKRDANDHVSSRRLLRQFIGRFPTDAKAAQVQRMLGDSYFIEQKFPEAVVEYRKVLTKYKRNRSAVALALYKIGMSFYELKWCTDAKSFLQQFVRKHRRHGKASSAKKVLKLIRRYRRNRQFCIS